jgi:hypothetical protein
MWVANLYRDTMCNIVFALYDVVPGESNRAGVMFAAFLSVYLMLRKLRFTEDDLHELNDRIATLHRYRYYIGVIYIACPQVSACSKLQFFKNITPNALRKRKFHSMFKHWVSSIINYAAPYWYSAEANEEYHKLACKMGVSISYISSICVRYLALQWSYRLTNKRDFEDQMVARMVEYDAMSMATQAIPALTLASRIHAPPKPVTLNRRFGRTPAHIFSIYCDICGISLYCLL